MNSLQALLSSTFLCHEYAAPNSARSLDIIVVQLSIGHPQAPVPYIMPAALRIYSLLPRDMTTNQKQSLSMALGFLKWPSQVPHIDASWTTLASVYH